MGAGRIFWNGTMGTIDMKLDASFAGFALTGEGRQLGIYYYNGAIVDAVSEQNLPIESTKWALSGF